MKNVVAGSLFGTALETYDLYLYGTAAALIFGPLFSQGLTRQFPGWPLSRHSQFLSWRVH